MDTYQKTILLVEDEAIIALTEKSWLINEGYKVVNAASGEMAIEKVRANPASIDLILMDIDLGQNCMDGTQAAREILKDYDIPLLFLSSHTESEIVSRTEQITSYGYVVKGFDPTVLLASIKMAFKLYQANQKVKNHEQALIEREFLLNESQKAAKIGTYKVDFKTGIWSSSRILSEIFGINQNYARNVEGWLNIVHPEDRNMMDLYLERILKEQTNFDKEYKIKRPLDGKEFWVHGIGKIDYDDAGNPLTMIGTIQDISERKLSEIALRTSEESLSVTLHSIGDGVIATDINGFVVRMNPTAQKLCGWNINEASGRPLPEVFHIINAKTREIVPNPVEKVLETGMVIGLANHTVLISRDGTEYQVADSAAPILNQAGEKLGVVLVFSDVTEKYKTEQMLAESKEFFEQMYLQSSTSTQILDAEGWCVRINPKLSEVFGVKPEHIEGKIYNIFKDEEIRHQGIDLILREVFDKKKTAQWEVFFDIGAAADSQEIEVEQKQKVWFKNKAYPILDERGVLLYVIIQHEDITEKKRAEEALNESNELNKSLLQTIPFGMDIVDEDGNILFMNRNLEKLFSKEAIGRKCWELYRDDKIQCTGCPLLNGIKVGETSTHEIHDIMGGNIFEINHTGLIFQGKMAMLEIFQNITDRKRSELQIQKYAEELKIANETKDKFFSIIAHDLRGPFNGFIGLTEYLKTNLDDFNKEDISECAIVLNSTARKIYELLNNLLEWSRLQTGKMEFQPAELNIYSAIEDTINLFSSAASGKSISFINEVSSDTNIYADQHMVSAILRNLVSNAIKFTMTGGRISFSSRSVNSSVEISVSDSGIGMTRELIEKVFRIDSVFTTRGTNNEEGSGLGLILCKELVERNGGEIKVESVPGKMTTFTFTSPALKK